MDAKVLKKSGKEATSRKGATVRKYTLHSKKNQLLKTDQISIEYEGEVRYLTEFIDLMQKNIKDVNQILSLDKDHIDQRIRFTGNSNFRPKKHELVFGFKIKLRTNSWTLYKSMSCIRNLGARHPAYISEEETGAEKKLIPFEEPSFDLAKFQKINDIKDFDLLEYSNKMARYLTAILKSTEHESKTDKVLAFLGISHPAYELNYTKIGEVAISKRSQGRINENALVKCLKTTFVPWQRRWMVVGTNSIWYYSNYGDHSYMIKDNIKVDSTSMVDWTSISDKGVEFTLNFSRRKMILSSYCLIEGLNAIHYLTQMLKVNEYCRLHLYESFSPRRKDNRVQFFADGESYFEKVFDIFRLAEREIFICGWMVSPEMPLKRPFNKKLDDAPQFIERSLGGTVEDHFAREKEALSEDSRLSRVLLSVAKRGVNVYIIVYKEFNLKMFNDSEHAAKTLSKLHPRIKVLRHPNKFFSLWSHHEKVIVVDRKLAMVGGLDLTWGRWDTCDHPLFDNGNPQVGEYFPGVDYYNPMIKDIVKGRLFEDTLLKDKSKTPRMPWHDVACMVHGSSVKDLVTHFTSYWNHAKEFCDEDEALFSVMVVKDDAGKMIDQVNSMSDEGEEVANVIAALDIDKFIENFNATKDWNDEIGNPSQELKKFYESFLNVALSLVDPLENDIQDFDNALEVEMESEDEDSNQSEEDKQDANNRWLDKDERHQLKEEEIVGHLHFSHVFSSTKHENVFRKLEVTFNQELYSIPFFEDHDIEVNSVNIGKDMCNLQETPSHHAHDELKIDFLALNPANSNDLDDSWCHLNYEFMNTLTDISRVSLEAMPRKGDSPLAAHLTIGISPRASLKPKLSMTRESMRFSNGQNLFQIEDIPLLYSPADIPLIEYMKCRPKDDKDKGLAGFFAHFIPDTLVEQAADKQGTANKDAKDDDPPSSKYFAEFKVEPLSLGGLFLGIEGSNAKKKYSLLSDVIQDMPSNKLRIQVLRSASHWSIGLRKKETSIHYAYVQNILLAKRFIYIENQFFLSATKRSSTNKSGIKNSIIKALFYRIKQAIIQKEPFKVIVFIPLLPAFEGQLDEGKNSGIIMQVQMGRANSTIGVGVHSLLARLRKITNKPEEYIVFCSLRTFSPKKSSLLENLGSNTSSEPPKTNLIYIHSKLMIVDDRKLIIGSANLNDRSMLGYRDSELALYIEGPDDLQLNVIGNNHSFKVNTDIHQFRCSLFSEHFGLDEETVRDPTSSMFWKSALNVAHYNTKFYEKVFNVYPTNSYYTWKDFLENSQNNDKIIDLDLFKRCQKNVKGHAVMYPFEFLKKEKLKLAARNTHLQVVPVRALF